MTAQSEDESFENPGIRVARDGTHWFYDYYTAVAPPERLVGLGYCRVDQNGRLQSASGLYAQVSRRLNGSVRVTVQARRFVKSDVRFREAMDRILNGAACPDFTFPVKRPKSQRRRREKTAQPEPQPSSQTQLPPRINVSESEINATLAAWMYGLRLHMGRELSYHDAKVAFDAMSPEERQRVYTRGVEVLRKGGPNRPDSEEDAV